MGKIKKILVVEDEPTLNNVISKRLESLEYNVTSCLNGNDAWNTIRKESFDIIVMDIMMPGMTGTDVLLKMNENKIRIPVLFLTAKDSIQDRVDGLELGAQDYLVKPFAFNELLARIKVILRNNQSRFEHVLQIEDLTLDKTSHTVKRGGKTIALSSKEFNVLEYMMHHQGEVLSRERIESDVWEVECCGLTNVIDVYIRYLRKKIDDDFDTKLIHTIRGVGYVLRVEK